MNKVSSEYILLAPEYEDTKKSNISGTFNNKYPMNIGIVKQFGSDPYLKYIVDSAHKFEKVIEKSKIIYAKDPKIQIIMSTTKNKKLNTFIAFSPNFILCDFLLKYSQYRFRNSSDKKNNWKLNLIVIWHGCEQIKENGKYLMHGLINKKAIFSDELLIDINSLKKFMNFFKNHVIFKHGDNDRVDWSNPSCGNSVRFNLVSSDEIHKFDGLTPTEILSNLGLN